MYVLNTWPKQNTTDRHGNNNSYNSYNKKTTNIKPMSTLNYDNGIYCDTN